MHTSPLYTHSSPTNTKYPATTQIYAGTPDTNIAGNHTKRDTSAVAGILDKAGSIELGSVELGNVIGKTSDETGSVELGTLIGKTRNVGKSNPVKVISP